MSDLLTQLAATLEKRKEAAPDESYVASLHDKGLNKILEKVGEEATEVVLAAKDAGRDNSSEADRAALVGEVADLWFHNMVMLSYLNIDVNEVLDCLGGRFGVSGLEEKASRDS